MAAEVQSDGLRWSLKQIAERDSISVKAVSKAVARLIETDGLAVSRDARGRVSAVDLAQYDHLRRRTDNPSRVQAAATVAGREARDTGGGDYNAALTEKTRYEAIRRRLEVEELQGQLVRVDAIADAATRIASDLARLIDQMPQAADTLAAALARDGSRGLQVELKKLAHTWRERLADKLAGLAAGGLDGEADDDTDSEIQTDGVT